MGKNIFHSSYEDAVSYILDIPKFTKKNPLEHTARLLDMLGEPQKGLKVIHVAGTNGKGSVCAFLGTILKEAGIRAGVFTSPHLVKINERFRIDMIPVSDEEFFTSFCEVKAASERMTETGYGHPTFFEFLFAMALVSFRRSVVEYVILETGLGGRLDATNVLEQVQVSVITAIGLDHTEILGSTIAEIAAEKAGIIKPGTPVVFAEGAVESDRVIRQRAAKCQSDCRSVGSEHYEILRNRLKNIDFSLHSGYYENTVFTIHSSGLYQAANAALAAEAVCALEEQERIAPEVVRSGIEKMYWPGRMQECLPDVYLDGAHNPQAVAEFLLTAEKLRAGREAVLLFAAVKEKDYREMLGQISAAGIWKSMILTQVPGARAVEPEALAEYIADEDKQKIQVIPNVGQAFQEAVKEKGDGVLFCAGSLYLIGEIIGILADGKVAGGDNAAAVSLP